jgi:hypothetical protein
MVPGPESNSSFCLPISSRVELALRLREGTQVPEPMMVMTKGAGFVPDIRMASIRLVAEVMASIIWGGFYHFNNNFFKAGLMNTLFVVRCMRQRKGAEKVVRGLSYTNILIL